MSDISTRIRNAQKRINDGRRQVTSQLGSIQQRVSSSKFGEQVGTAQAKVAGAVPAALRGGNLSRTQKLQLAGIGSVSAAVLACGIAIPATSGSSSASQSVTASEPAAYSSLTGGNAQAKELHASITNQQAGASEQAKAAEAKIKAAEAKTKATKDRATKQAASRNAERKAVKSYPNNLDGWIRESLDIMKAKGIPGSYEGLHRNIMRESSGNTRAINLWDINAQNGIPSKGLLQVIQPTFDHWHVEGTSHDIYDPVANITAAANYAAERYGSMDNVNSAY
ncbi:transglycosylase SLT domain-containing protein [Streptomyces sp. NPDC004959]|uniref:transglycosylase SLT domain-containing protein n=1 Tax=unclassified Streptomyces TaxID=2593676 RepID=UPI0004C72E23|nr:transglycosylase SLT domain-containing protein [Streptomyces sp. NRRL F-5630]